MDVTGGPPTPFAARFAAVRARLGPLVWGLDPSGPVLEQWGVGDDADGLDRFVDVCLDAAPGAVGVVKPQAAFYERHGWRGMRSLGRLVDGMRGAGVLVILDAKRGDVGSTNTAYAEAYLGDRAAMPVDALTLTAYLGLDAMGPFVEAAHAGGAALFVVVRSSNPEGRPLQTARVSGDATVEEHLLAGIAALNADLAPGRVGPVGAVVGATHQRWPVDLAGVNGLFLAPGLGAQGATPDDVAAAFGDCPDRVLPSASRQLLAAGPAVGDLRAALEQLSANCTEALGG